VIELRPMTDDDLPDLRRLDDLAFGVTTPDPRWDAATAGLERDRQTAAVVDGDLAGHAAVFSHELTVPGGLAPAAGVTWVMVSPLHRRRGVLSALMEHQLADLHEDGEAVATLWASEAAIYPRFGYGQASRRMSMTVPRAHAALTPSLEVQARPRLRVGEVPSMRAACERVYDDLRPQRPGMVSRSPGAWLESSYDDPAGRDGGSELRCVLVEGETGGPTGYAWYRTTPSWDTGSPEGQVDVQEIVAGSPATTRALVGFLLDIDLMSRTTLWNLPVDHPLPLMLRDPRRARQAIADALWVRLVRLDDALSARRYAAEVDVVLEVTDRRCPQNAGRWRLAAGRTGAAVSRTASPPDLTMDVATLGSAYLGDATLVPAYGAGLVVEHTAGSLQALHRAMLGEVAPWCSYVF
jgi:predicted acetyltransferase